MNRCFRISLIVAFLLAPLVAVAQVPVTDSGFQVQNLSESVPANLFITYYQEADGAVAATQEDVVPAGGSLTFFNGREGTRARATLPGFRGSVVIESDQPIVAITNLLVGPYAASSFSSFKAGSAKVSLPLIVRNNFGVDTSFSVQNTGATPVHITVAYTPGVIGNGGVTDDAWIEPGASATFSQADESALGERFVGSATITSSEGGSIAATVQQRGSSQLLSYDGFNSSATKIAVPLVIANNYGSFTGLQIQNAGTAEAQVTLAYGRNAVGTCGSKTLAPFRLAPGGSRTFIQHPGTPSEGFDDFFHNCRYIGSATISNDGTQQPLVAIVNQVTTRSRQASAYEGFAVSTATGKVKAPLVFANNHGYFSGVQVQNIGTSDITVAIDYGPNTVDAGGGFPACPEPATRENLLIKANSSRPFIQAFPPNSSEAEGYDRQFANCRYVGAATITASSGQIIAIVNQVANSQGDALLTYNAFNQ